MNNHIKHNYFFALTLLISSQIYAANRMQNCAAPVCQMPSSTTRVITTEPSKPQMQQTEEDRRKAAILSHVAQIANSIANIAVNSKDRSNVGMQVGNVLGNVIGIAMVASQKNGRPMDLQTAEMYLKSLDEQTKMKIAAMITTEMTRSMGNRS